MSSHPAVFVHGTHGSASCTAVILRSADSSDHCRRGRVRLQRLLVLGGNLEHLDLVRVVVGGAGLPLVQVVVLDDILMGPGGEGGQGEGAGAGPVGATQLVTSAEVRGHHGHDGPTLNIGGVMEEFCIQSSLIP